MVHRLKGRLPLLCAALLLTGLVGQPAAPRPVGARGLEQPTAQRRVFFTTGAPDGRIGMATRPGPGSGANQETETGDDFILTSTTRLTEATFTGLLPAGTPLSSIQQVVVEIYRVFPKDSNTTRTPRVPTRTNSPSDVAFAERDSADESLHLSTSLLNPTFMVANSVDTGIHPAPNQTTGGEGPKTGEEVQFTAIFSKPFILPADHYFVVPQVRLSDGHFLWLSAAGPPQFTGDLQTWIRNEDLDPDWLRVGTDIVSGPSPPTFNAAFSLTGTPLLGDLNEDLVVNVLDLALFAQDFGKTGTGLRGDLNLDSVVNATDLAIFAQNFGLTGP